MSNIDKLYGIFSTKENSVLDRLGALIELSQVKDFSFSEKLGELVNFAQVCNPDEKLQVNRIFRAHGGTGVKLFALDSKGQSDKINQIALANALGLAVSLAIGSKAIQGNTHKTVSSLNHFRTPDNVPLAQTPLETLASLPLDIEFGINPKFNGEAAKDPVLLNGIELYSFCLEFSTLMEKFSACQKILGYPVDSAEKSASVEDRVLNIEALYN